MTVAVFWELLNDELIEPISMKNTNTSINAEPRHDANINLKNCFIFLIVKIFAKVTLFSIFLHFIFEKMNDSETVFVLVGSNVGDREMLVNQAVMKMADICGKVVAKSPVYESEPWGFECEQWFLNQVVKIETMLGPDELMKRLLAIELELGRDRVTPHEGYASRTMDLDILYFGSQIIETEYVTAPHPRLHQRRFALLPLCDLNPDMLHPRLKKTNAELLRTCDDNCVVKKLRDEI